MAGVTSIIDFVNDLLEQALEERASDIHIEHHHDTVGIRFRIDGLLFDRYHIDGECALQLVSRIKIMASIDIAKKRIPQDGKITFVYRDYSVDCRVSTFPSIYGEKIVIRLLDNKKEIARLDQLGLSSTIRGSIEDIMQHPHGLLLVTGPTGSGKTTTLYAMIDQLNDRQRHIITLEDPIEYAIDGVTQAQINPEAGFTFAKGIRSMLRQDPDIIMIGEIRDKESARIAMEASLTGHVVLSTLHTNDAPSAIIRLLDMDIEPYLINASLIAVIAQRLVRTVCISCKERIGIVHEGESLNVAQGRGCNECNFIGTKGRVGVFELLSYNEHIKQLMKHGVDYPTLRAAAIQHGMKTLYDDGIAKVKNETISLDDLLKSIK